MNTKNENNPNTKTKQVIVIRKDLKMRRGKEIAQGSHASMAFITRRMTTNKSTIKINISDVERLWLSASFAKVCVRVNSEEELKEIYENAKNSEIEAHLIVDSGLTEFGGVSTPTCCALGPDYADKLDEITGYLTLY